MAKLLGKIKPIAAVVLCGVLVCALGGCPKRSQSEAGKGEFEIDKTYERGPLTVHVRVDKGTLTIAETLRLQFEATAAQEYEVQMPKVDAVLKDFGLVDWDNLGRRLDKDGNVVSTYQYRLEPFLSGKYELPAFTFVFWDVNDVDHKFELESEPIAVEVTSLLGDERAKLDIADIEDVVEMPEKASLLWLLRVVVLVVLAGGGVGLWLFLRSRKARALVRIFRPAHEIAYARLRALVKEKLVEAGRIREFYERISGILRQYVEDRFDLRAPERTTEEFLVELQFTETLSAADKEKLGEFLQHCDLVKFAKYAPSGEQIQRTFDLVKEFIERTRSDERRVDVTDQAQAASRVGAEVA